MREKVKSSSKRGLLQGSGVSEPDTERPGRDGEAVGFETVLRDQQEGKGGVRTEHGGCRILGIHTLLSLLGLLTGAVATGGGLSSPAPTEVMGCDHVTSNSTSKCYSGIRGRAARHRCMADVRAPHAMLVPLTRVMPSAAEQTASQLGHRKQRPETAGHQRNHSRPQSLLFCQTPTALMRLRDIFVDDFLTRHTHHRNSLSFFLFLPWFN